MQPPQQQPKRERLPQTGLLVPPRPPSCPRLLKPACHCHGSYLRVVCSTSSPSSISLVTLSLSVHRPLSLSLSHVARDRYLSSCLPLVCHHHRVSVSVSVSLSPSFFLLLSFLPTTTIPHATKIKNKTNSFSARTSRERRRLSIILQQRQQFTPVASRPPLPPPPYSQHSVFAAEILN